MVEEYKKLLILSINQSVKNYLMKIMGLCAEPAHSGKRAGAREGGRPRVTGLPERAPVSGRDVVGHSVSSRPETSAGAWPVRRLVGGGVRASRDVGDASASSSAESTRRPLVARSTERGPGRVGGIWGGSGRRRRARTSRRPQQQQQSPESPCKAPRSAPLWAPRRGRPGREPLPSRSPSATALRTLGPILALLLRLLHLGLGSGGCREDVPPSGRGKKEEKMKKYRRALALVSCLSLCSLVWLPSWHVCCKESSSASTSYYSQDHSCVLENEDVQFQKKDEREGLTNDELLGKSASNLPVPPEENKLRDNYIVDVQHTVSES
uniref:Uncharacterized protein LOC109689124 n=1 Tax=Castor canadensis TaxID=51338 RepID=A0A8B7UUU5_CASCN|nr:uncharacterized protein LOC109689124 [Castor canadensis]